MIDHDALIRASGAKTLLASVRDDGAFFPAPHIRDLALSAVRAAGGPLAATARSAGFQPDVRPLAPDVGLVAASRLLPVR